MPSSVAALLITSMAMVAEPPKRAAPAAGGDVTPENAGSDVRPFAYLK
jgi:hypothetical protein